MPPLQTGSVQNNSVQMLAAMRDNLRSSENSTTGHLHERATGLKVMIVGDSISQGREGDFTWRYRIWEWFQSQGVAVDFVGPYTGTVQPDKAAPPSPPALYGEPQPTGAIKVSGGYAKEEVMAAHPADLMLLLLGFNDMGWFYSDSIGTLDSVHTLINNARAANPKIKFAIANVSQRSFIGGREDLPVSTNIYNSLLRDTIPKWSTTASPIHLVELEENYNCQPSSCPVGSDGLHPNAMGEYQIARAFSQTLVKDFRIGSSALSIPNDVPARPLPVPSNFKVFTSPGGVTATWDPVYGAYNYDVRSKIKGGIPNFSSGSVSSNRWDATWPIDGWEYEVQVRASAGDTIKGDWTTTLTATAHPQTAEAPQNVIVSATTTGFDISWDPPTGSYSDSVIEYNVLYWDKDAECDFITGAAFTGTSAHINNLVAGHRYFVAVETWNAAGQGFPAVVRSVIPGAGTPPPPTDLKIIAADQTTVHLTWDSLSAAAGYRLWLRNVNATGSKLEALNYTVEAACSDQYYLFPGTWNYEWCVSAFNGNAESAKGKCVLAPSPDEDGEAAPTCPPAPQWCPNGGGVGGGSGGGGSGGGGDSGGSSSGGTTEEPWPVVTNGQCKGPDCKNGQCTGLLCASFGCSGSGCLNGFCTAFGKCTVHGCLGSGCRDGVCVADDCITAGCVGDDCGEDGKCTDDRCIGLGCSGSDCGKDGLCTGPDCWEGTCSGSGCANGVCSGSKCSSYDGCVGKGCNNGSCKGDDCSSCSGSDCHDGDCTGDNCIGCTGPDCHNGQCTGSNCYGCTGRDCHHGTCRGEHCSSCVGSDCVVSNGKSGYELNWMDGFWKYLFNTPGYSCDNFNQLMFDGCNKLQPIYDNLPGDDHWDFVGVTQELNSIKAQMGGAYEQNIVQKSKKARKKTIARQKPWGASRAIIDEWMELLQTIVLACDLWTSSAIFGPLDSTNYRIYSALKNVDANLATTYRYWMTNVRIPEQMKAGSEQAALLITSIEEGLNIATTKAIETADGAARLNEYREALQAIRDRYHLDGTGNVCKKPINLNWDRATTGGAPRPPLARRDSCPFPITTKDPANPTSTSTAPTKTTTSLSIPTATTSSDPIYCFNEHNDGSYVPFKVDGAKAAMEALCYNGNSLKPGGPPYTYVYSDPSGTNVIGSVQWAPDQSGCKPEKEVEMKIHCETSIEHCFSKCRNPTEGYGGAFIENQGFGCIQWMLYGQKSNTQCSCNENGCTPDSPACCANGSCGTSNALMSTAMKLISLDEVDPALSLSLSTKSTEDD
ncbi:hypothetical protein BDV33DRAFT_232960 [Aspergillus novoparasiticus]|uniref:Fibronectin type-III domain-containing protein n=1 Tax=Aspergillus novoparasiticus TaxID=986946 RepID=A0A5N6EJ06_9EURO|nr:hypothetical protein BDV33DRAFT_232960 [Aspergillus novoparasiticus]